MASVHTIVPLFGGHGDDLYANVPDLLNVLLGWENEARRIGDTAQAAVLKSVREQFARGFEEYDPR